MTRKHRADAGDVLVEAMIALVDMSPRTVEAPIDERAPLPLVAGRFIAEMKTAFVLSNDDLARELLRAAKRTTKRVLRRQAEAKMAERRKVVDLAAWRNARSA